MNNPGAGMHEPTVATSLGRSEPSVHSGTLTVCAHLAGLSLRRQLLSRHTLVSIVLAGLACLIVVAWSMQKEPSAKKFAQDVIVPVLAAILLPIYAICYGASSIGSEREDRTLIYLLTTPLPRPLIYLTKYAVATMLVVAWTLGTLAVLSGLAGEHGREPLRLFWPAVLLGAWAYGSLFHLLGAAFRRGTIVSLAYTFFLEFLLGNMPGIVKRVSLSFYTSCMIYDAGSGLGVKPVLARELFLPISGRSAAIVLALTAIALLALGLLVFTRREYRDLS
jgi:ABC-2 type transport system permease protein